MKDRQHILRDESTEKGRSIWRKVDRAAARAPEWLRVRVDQAPLRGESDTVAPSGARERKGGRGSD